MTIMELVTLFGIMVALAATPSASVALVVTRSATLGVLNGLAVSAGVVLGDLAFITLAVLGLSVVAETLGSLFVIIKILGGCYLLWVGLCLLREKSTTNQTFIDGNRQGSLFASFLAGFFLTLGDVKAIIFYASLLPQFVDLRVIEEPEVIAIVLITLGSVGGVKAVYAIFSNKLMARAKKARLAIATRKTAGTIMAGVGTYLIVKA